MTDFEDVQEAARLYRQGDSFGQVAEKMGITVDEAADLIDAAVQAKRKSVMKPFTTAQKQTLDEYGDSHRPSWVSSELA